MNNIQRVLGLFSILSLGAAVGCGNSPSTGTGGGSTTGGTGGSGSGGGAGSGGGGGSPGGPDSVKAQLPGGTVSFSGGAAAVYGNVSKELLRIVINEGGASCDMGGVHSSAGQHELELDLIGIGGVSAPFSAMTYSDANAGSTSVHAEAYLYTPCGNVTLAGNGGEAPFSVTVTSIDATQVAGTFTMTMTEHVPGGKQFPMTGSFAAPICAQQGLLVTCQ